MIIEIPLKEYYREVDRYFPYNSTLYLNTLPNHSDDEPMEFCFEHFGLPAYVDDTHLDISKRWFGGTGETVCWHSFRNKEDAALFRMMWPNQFQPLWGRP
ncbi:MAG: hypothetical protein EOO61_10500 [Hymenobacter sp.]|nr:MAG: hypothetical protein EOO61_10500 [Hymenobacter sp.]